MESGPAFCFCILCWVGVLKALQSTHASKSAESSLLVTQRIDNIRFDYSRLVCSGVTFAGQQKRACINGASAFSQNSSDKRFCLQLVACSESVNMNTTQNNGRERLWIILKNVKINIYACNGLYKILGLFAVRIRNCLICMGPFNHDAIRGKALKSEFCS